MSIYYCSMKVLKKKRFKAFEKQITKSSEQKNQVHSRSLLTGYTQEVAFLYHLVPEALVICLPPHLLLCRSNLGVGMCLSIWQAINNSESLSPCIFLAQSQEVELFLSKYSDIQNVLYINVYSYTFLSEILEVDYNVIWYRMITNVKGESLMVSLLLL